MKGRAMQKESQQLEFAFVTQASSLPMPAAKKANASTTEQQRERADFAYRRTDYGYGPND
jgi:hypothetical protein